MEKEEKIKLNSFKAYEENYQDLLPKPPVSRNTNVWAKGQEMEIPGNWTTGKAKTIKVKLCETKGWTETKTEWELICRRVWGQRVCTHGWVSYRRTCSKRFYLVLKHPKLDTIKTEVNDCIKSSAAVAVTILLTTGNIAVATTSFKESFVSCLELKGVKFAKSIGIAITEQKKCGSWRHIS